MYFVMKTAIARLGGLSQAAQLLGVSVQTLSGWITVNRRARPDDATLHQLAQLTGISLGSFLDYYTKWESYKKREGKRRRS